MTLFPPDRPVIFETPRVRVRRIRTRRGYVRAYLVIEQFFNAYPGGGSWTRLIDYALDTESVAIACAQFLDRGGSFAQWRDMRKAKGLPR